MSERRKGSNRVNEESGVIELDHGALLCHTNQAFRSLRSVAVSVHVADYRNLLALTAVMGRSGAFGKINLTSLNFPRRRQFSARETLGGEDALCYHGN